MAPGIHPPCTPSASCQPMRCHPTPPPCADPEKCLKQTISKNIKPCPSAVSIMATRAKANCRDCNKYKCVKGNKDIARDTKAVEQYLKRKSQEYKMKRKDRLTGSKDYVKYHRAQGVARRREDCCAGVGHRGRLKKGSAKSGSGPCGKCTIL